MAICTVVSAFSSIFIEDVATATDGGLTGLRCFQLYLVPVCHSGSPNNPWWMARCMVLLDNDPIEYKSVHDCHFPLQLVAVDV